MWVQGTSLVKNAPTFVPAQTISAAIQPKDAAFPEPLIKTQTTIGLATWTTQAGARLAGLLEIIEREAYMIMWYNQLTLPRIDITSLVGKSPALDKLLADCKKYRLKVHLVQMITDAPTHAVCAILEDESDIAPRYAFGLKAHRSLSHAAERAILEALRGRRSYRSSPAKDTWNSKTSVDTIGHRERIFYWSQPEHTKHLSFLTQGPVKKVETMVWEHDSIEEHLSRMALWLRDKGYEAVSVSLTSSRANTTSLHVEMVVAPELLPTHLTEDLRHLSTTRMHVVARQFGYTPREQPFIQAPHPYY